LQLTFGNRQGKSSAGAFLRTALCACLALTGCAALDEPGFADYEGEDYWDSGLVYHQHIDVAMLSSGFSSDELMLSGFVSAVSVNANDLYFIDEGSGQLVQVDLAAMTAKAIVRLRSPSVPGLHVDIDGKVYVVDRANGRLLVYDTYLADIHPLSLGSFLANPFDLAIGGQGQWLFVLDSLDGTIATVDVFGGVTQVMRPELPSSMSFNTPAAITAVGSSLLVLDAGADQVVEFDPYGRPVGVYAADELANPRSLAADSCGRFFVADDHGLFVGFADMSLPGRRVAIPELAGRNISDLWTDGVFVYVATRDDGIHTLLLDPSCGAP
jgi:hypothetical protein